MVSAENSTPAGGSYFVLIHLTNHGRTACQTGGYPGIAVLSDSGRQVLQAVRTAHGVGGGLPSSTDRWPAITLRPGQEATAVLEGADRPESGSGECPRHSALLVTPPDTTVSVRLRATTFTCRAPQIHPLLIGRSGSST